MASTIKLKNSTTAGNSPSSLETGEVAINVADGNLFYGSASAVLQNFVVDELEVKGNLTAQQYIVSSSVTYMTQSFSSGSTIFGDTQDDTHQFTGSVDITGSINVSGKVGVGTASPSEKLTVESGILLVTGSGASGYGFQLDRAGFDTYRLSHLDGGLTVYNVDDARKEMTFDGSGNVGIGTTSPTEKLTVAGNISASGTITANSFTGNGLSIDGPSNSHVELGTYNVGFDVAGANTFFITGSGLIISGAMADQNHHNFLKIGQIEFVDVNTNPLAGATSNTLLIHNVNEFLITSGADGGNITTAGRLFRHKGASFEIYRNNSSVMAASENGNVTFSGQNISFQANGETSLKATNATPGVGAYAVFAEANPNTSPQVLRSIKLNESFPYLGGAITASVISASGTIIGSNLSGTNTGDQDLSGFLSSSAQIASDISGSFTAASASFSTRVTANDAKLTADTSNVTAAGALMDSELSDLAAVKAIDQGLTTTSDVVFNKIGLGSGGTASSPVIYRTGDTDTGIYWPNSNNIALQAGGGGAELNVSTTGVTIAGSNGDLYVSNDIIHNGDSDTQIRFTTNNISLEAGGTQGTELDVTGSTLPNVKHNVYDTASLELGAAGGAIGDIVKFGGTSTTAGKVYYLKPDGTWGEAQANAGGTASSSLAVALGSNSTTNGMCLRGIIHPSTDPGATIGHPVFLSDTNSGQMLATAPDTSGDFVRIVGHQFGTNLIYFNPSPDFIKHA